MKLVHKFWSCNRGNGRGKRGNEGPTERKTQREEGEAVRGMEYGDLQSVRRSCELHGSR